MWLISNIIIVDYQYMKNRVRTEMLAAMLEVAKGKVTKTKIMYTAFLSYNQLKEYISILIENNLIEYLDGTHL